MKKQTKIPFIMKNTNQVFKKSHLENLILLSIISCTVLITTGMTLWQIAVKSSSFVI
jgi:hypothetical protein